jgi:hypothetical protein
VPRTDSQTSTTGSRRPAPRRVAAWAILAFAVALIAAPDATGQIVRLDPETPRSVTLSGAQIDALGEFIDQYADDAFGDDRGQAARALDELIDPLLGEGVSVAFRQAMADRLIDRIDAALTDQPVMLEDEDGNKAINHKPFHAMRLAGEIATNTTLQRIVEQLDSEDEGRAYFAVHAIETVFFRMRTSAPAVSGNTLISRRQGGKATGLIPDLGALMVKTDSGRRAAAIARALAEAAELPEDEVPGASDEALRLIAESAAARVRAAADRPANFEDTLSWLTAGQRVVRVIAQPGSADEPTAKASIRLGGQLIAAVLRDLEKQNDPANIPADAMKVHNQMLGLAENLLLFGEQNAAAASGRRPNSQLNEGADRIQDLFKDGDIPGFRRAAIGLISPNGLLTDAPYGFTDDEFIVE